MRRALSIDLVHCRLRMPHWQQPPGVRRM